MVGSTVFTPEELAKASEPWTGRAIGPGELQDLADAVTSLYVRNGYVSSGAVVPDQDVEDGVITIQVVEGVLSDVVIEGSRWYREGLLRKRVRASLSDPINMIALERELQVLLQEPAIRRIHAELLPGPRRGESVLALRVEEQLPFELQFAGGNDRSPSIGSWGGKVYAANQSLLGFGDVLETQFEKTEGYDSEEGRYTLPLNRYGTELLLRFRRSHGKVVESPFDKADIKSETWTARVGLQQPLYRSPSTRVLVGVTGEWRRVTTWLRGRRFSFTAGPERGRSDLSVLRFFQEWTSRSRENVFAARSTVSWGINALDATTHSGGIPDGRFVAWLGQLQWAHLLPQQFLRSQVIFRTDLQVANDPLLSVEQFAVGGLRTVRGYRENQLVRDNGWVSSLELRVPLFPDLLGPHSIDIAPFMDYGRSWNEKRTQGQKTIWSIGLGLRYALSSRLQAQVYWGGRLKSAPTPGSDLQYSGLHFLLTLRAF